MKPPPEYELRGRRLLLRTLRPQDVGPRYLGWLRDPEVNKYLEVRFEAMDEPKLKAWVSRFDGQTRYAFAIRVAATEEFIGTATLYEIRPIHGLANYGYMIGEKAWWGQGVVEEALTLLFDFAFERVGVRKITGSCYAPHLASHVNFRKLGLTHEGTLRAQLKLGDAFVDEHVYSITGVEWRKRRERLASSAVAHRATNLGEPSP